MLALFDNLRVYIQIFALVGVTSRRANICILKRKRNATLSKMVVPSFSSENSASDNEIAKTRYLPCIQHQNQTVVTYGGRATTRNVRQPKFLK